MRDIDKVSSRIEGFYNLLHSSPTISHIYPHWFLGQVEEVEGPLKIGVLDKIREGSSELITWMDHKNNPMILN